MPGLPLKSIQKVVTANFKGTLCCHVFPEFSKKLQVNLECMARKLNSLPLFLIRLLPHTPFLSICKECFSIKLLHCVNENRTPWFG